jgi:glc operon protein GlcG
VPDREETMHALTHNQANDIARIAIEQAAARFKRPICVAVCDAAGFLLTFQRQDGAPLRSIAISQGKAYSAARMQVTTDALLNRIERENISVSYYCDDRITALPGGSPLKNAGGTILAAVGISGLTSAEDQEIADYLAGLVLQGAV